MTSFKAILTEEKAVRKLCKEIVSKPKNSPNEKLFWALLAIFVGIRSKMRVQLKKRNTKTTEFKSYG